jgi:two-component system cell cycle sensor histidine kinase/response regulator CckA
VLAQRAVDVNVVVLGVSQMLGRLLGEQIRLVALLDHEPAVIIADPGQLEQVLVNLGINARDAMPDGGTLEIRIARIEDGATLRPEIGGPAVLLTVTDTGSGMDAQTLAHAFEPFFTTKQAGSGTGLGLATVHGIVHQSSGEIWAESTVGRGTSVSVLFRRVDAEPEIIPGPPIVKTPAASSGTVLVVEDEPGVRAFVVATLERAGHHVLVAGSPAEAVALTEGLAERIDVLVTDLIMPETNGQVLAKRLLEGRPSMRVVLMSGYGAGLEPSADTDYRFLAKPFARDDLIAAVATALAEGETGRS